MISLWAHPRSRGDHLWVPPSIFRVAGSSPLARGPPKSMWVQRWWQGLIPARAGTTLWGHLLVRRGCGSSPLARGPLISDAINIITGRLIPARAGTTPRSMMSGWPTGAHPRSRGDHILELFGLACGWGSSPLARGPPRLQSLGHVRGGLIPARAGTTPMRPKTHRKIGAHPRSRGDHVHT